MDEHLKTERLVILSLAHMEADRKYWGVHWDIKRQEERLLQLPTSATEERQKIEADIIYLRDTCLAGWQETLNQIQVWNKELE